MRRRLWLLLACIPLGGAPAQPVQGWELWIVKPSRPGIAQSCAALGQASAPLDSTLPSGQQPQRLDESLSIRWRGGELVQTGPTPGAGSERSWSPFDSCFVLMVAGKPVAAGAVLPRASAQLLRFETLVYHGGGAGRPLSFELLPAFPSNLSHPVPARWEEALAPVSRSSEAPR